MRDFIRALQGLDQATAEKVAEQLEREFSGPTFGQLSRVVAQVVESSKAKPAPAPAPSQTPAVTPAPAPSPAPAEKK